MEADGCLVVLRSAERRPRCDSGIMERGERTVREGGRSGAPDPRHDTLLAPLLPVLIVVLLVVAAELRIVIVVLVAVGEPDNEAEGGRSAGRCGRGRGAARGGRRGRGGGRSGRRRAAFLVGGAAELARLRRRDFGKGNRAIRGSVEMDGLITGNKLEQCYSQRCSLPIPSLALVFVLASLSAERAAIRGRRGGVLKSAGGSRVALRGGNRWCSSTSKGSESQSLRRNSKHAANRQPRPKRSVEQGEEVEDVDRFRVVKRTKRATAAGRAESSTRAAVGGGDATSSTVDAEASSEGVEVAARGDVERPSQAGRLRASPGQFAKFNSSLSPPQKPELVSRFFGDLLNLSDTLPGDFSKFLVQSYQPKTSEMVFRGRGRIRVDADSVQRILYLDVLVHDIPVSNCAIRVNAWDSNLIAKVIKKDSISPGVFSKLQLKEEYRGTEQTPLFGGLLQAQAFVASKLPLMYNLHKKAKIAKVINDLCKAVTEQVGTFIEAVAKIDDEEPDIDPYVQQTSTGTPPSRRAPKTIDGSEGEGDDEDADPDDQEGSNGGNDNSDDDDDDNGPSSGGTGGNTTRNLPKSKKSDEAESQGSIDMFKLCNMKTTLPTTFPVPDFHERELCDKIDFAIDQNLFFLSEAKKNLVDMEEAGKGLDWMSKGVTMKKNLKLPQTKQQMPRVDAEINGDKEAVAQTVVPTIVIREPTTTQDVSAIPVEPTTITGVQQIKGKIPMLITPPKPAKQQKIVKFAKGTKEEQGRKGLPSSASLVPTQTAKMPTANTSVPTEVSISTRVTVKTSRVAQEDSTATTSPKVTSHRDSSMTNTEGGRQSVKLPSPRAITEHPSKSASPRANFQNTLTQEEVFNIVSRCKPPRPPTTTLL
uniref:Uncharacterized protein n=1 Tax=Triticum aestivum TaxID=4565 RepID=A0A077RYV9_WHEAT|nr:unnamed protein product [Triticum aestivum]